MGRPKKYPVEEVIENGESKMNTRAQEALEIDAEVLDAMPRDQRMRLTHMDWEGMTLRQRQRAGAEYLASLVNHPRVRREVAKWALSCPGEAMKLAASERPKEIHIDQQINHQIVVVPAAASEQEWLKNVIDAEPTDE